MNQGFAKIARAGYGSLETAPVRKARFRFGGPAQPDVPGLTTRSSLTGV